MNPDLAAVIAQLTSAFGDATRRAIYFQCRRAADGLTAAAVAAEFDLHPNVARHHLDKLVDQGYVEVVPATRSAAGSTAGSSAARRSGRPSKLYRASGKDIEIREPGRGDDLLAQLLARALESLPGAQATALAEQVGYDYGRSVAELAPGGRPATVERALIVLREVLDDHGFEASVEPGTDGLAVITAAHCPFGAAAHAYPGLVCALDRGMVRGMLASLYGETCPQTTASRPAGDPVCVTRV